MFLRYFGLAPLQLILYYCRSSCELNAEQQMVSGLVANSHSVYYGGMGGCGKTFVGKKIIKILKQKNVKFACTCTTGVSCTLYEDCTAQTLHAFSGIGQCTGTKEHLLKNVLTNEECVKQWIDTEVLLVDEISMLSMKVFDTIQYVSQKVRNSEYAFGGMQVVAFGDFSFHLLRVLLIVASIHLKALYGI